MTQTDKPLGKKLEALNDFVRYVARLGWWLEPKAKPMNTTACNVCSPQDDSPKLVSSEATYGWADPLPRGTEVPVEHFRNPEIANMEQRIATLESTVNRLAELAGIKIPVDNPQPVSD